MKKSGRCGKLIKTKEVRTVEKVYKNHGENFSCLLGDERDLDIGIDHRSSLEIVFLYKGSVNVWIGNNGAIKANEGDVIVIFPNQQYRYETCSDTESLTVCADIKKMSEFLSVLSSYVPKSNVIDGAAKNKELLALAEGMRNAYKDESLAYGETVLKGYAVAILGRVLSLTELKKNEIEDASTANEIISYCIENYREKLSLDVLERALHINKYYISHVINGKIGTSFNAYINSLRINEAARLLTESDMTVNEISAEVGFGTVRSFDRAFKKQKGETAREYRNRNSEKKKKSKKDIDK